MSFEERFGAGSLDAAVWMPSYLSACSRAESAATYTVGDDGLTLSIPPDQSRWCAGLHDEPPLRVSAIQSGNWSGPVGSTRGQQPFREGLEVREAQEELRGFTPHHGRIEVECRATIGPGSMFSAWMVGMEDEPERCGEICLVEVFGDSLRDDGTAKVGCGIHPFRDPALTEEFAAERRRIDVSETHSYAVEWGAGGVDFLHDGQLMRASRQSPAYPMMLILGVFDFPQTGPTDPVPELVVARVTGC